MRKEKVRAAGRGPSSGWRRSVRASSRRLSERGQNARVAASGCEQQEGKLGGPTGRGRRKVQVKRARAGAEG